MKIDNISNALPHLDYITVVVDEKQKIQRILHISYRMEENCIAEQEMEEKSLLDGSFVKKIPLEVFFYTGQKRKGLQLFEQLIRQQSREAPVKTVLRTHDGWNEWENQHFYVVGTEAMAHNLRAQLSEVRIFEERAGQAAYNIDALWQLLFLDEKVSPILFLNTIAGVLYSIINRNQQNRFVIYLYGRTASFKTTVAKLFSTIDENDASTLSLVSSEAGLRDAITKFRDRVVVIDDLNHAPEKSTERRNNIIVGDFCKSYVDSGRVLKKVGSHVVDLEFRCSVVLTAEYLLENPSTMNRCLLLNAENAITSEHLSKVQLLNQREEIMPTFVKLFTGFIADNYNEVEQRIQVDLQQKIVSDSKMKMPQGWQRIRQTQRVLVTAKHVFELYLQEKKCSSDLIEKLVRHLDGAIQSVCAEQLDFMRDCQKQGLGMKYIQALYLEIDQYVFMGDPPRSEKKFLKNRDYDSNYRLGFWNGDFFAMEGKIILELVRRTYPEASLKAISKELRQYGLCLVDSEGKMSIRANGTSKRYYNIRFEELEKIMDEYKED